MVLNLNSSLRDYTSDVLSYDEQESWTQAIWRGHVTVAEAKQEAKDYVLHAEQVPCALLLNDNTQLLDPWSDSLNWLLEVWVPQATRLGLRYVAHIVQADQYEDFFTLRPPKQLPFELQIFQDIADAQHWLREVRATLIP